MVGTCVEIGGEVFVPSPGIAGDALKPENQ